MFSIIFGYMSNWLEYFASFFGGKQLKTFIIIGLDNAGKTTLLGRMKSGRIIAANPTPQSTSETLEMGNLKFTAYDLGGHKQMRKIWRDYCYIADGIIFVIDASDRERLKEAKIELENILSEEEFIKIPVLILANKIDKSNAFGKDDLIENLDLFGKNQYQFMNSNINNPTGNNNYITRTVTDQVHGYCNNDLHRPMEVFMCSFLENQGYGAGFKWLAKNITS